MVEDDTAQTAAAIGLIERTIDEDATLYLSSIVITETVWVLSRSYRFTRGEIAAVIHRLLAARQLTFGSRSRINRALQRFEAGQGDFADYLIAEDARHAGIDRVATFDRALLREAGLFIPE